MATYTTNFNLEKPEASDEFGDFRTSYNSNMDIIDQNLGGGGGSSTLAGLTDVSITTPVTGDALIYDGAEWANTPLADVATSGDYTDLINTPSLATVATSGSYTDLSNKPTIPTALSDLSDDSTHRVVTDTQISTWNGKSDFSGSYNDLTDKPTIPTVNDGTLTIQQNGTTLGTFTANQSGNTTVNLSGGGGSAHTIVNESGAALADEPNLQFTDGLTATDDSVNTKTKVGVDTTFTESTTRTNIASGDSLATIFGKIKKWFSDLPSMFVSKSGDTMSNCLTINADNNAIPLLLKKNHTSTTPQLSAIEIGNNKASGSEGTCYGGMYLWGNGNKSTLLQARNSSADRTIDLPNNDGTVALTSDIPTNNNQLTNGSGFVYRKVVSSSSIGSVVVTHPESGSRWQMFAYGNGNGFPWSMSIVYTNTYCWCCSSSKLVRGVRFIDATHFAIVSGKWDQVTILTDDADVSIATSSVSYSVDESALDYPIATDSTKVSKSGDTMTGYLTIDTGVSGSGSGIKLGSTSSGSWGFVEFRNGSDGTLKTATLSASRAWTLPNKTGTVAMTSDISSRRFKENILPMTDDECTKILDVDVITFDYKAESKVVGENERVGNRGVIAEDVAELIPTAVEYEELDGEQVPYGVNYTKFIPYLIKMVQIQQKEINELKSMLADKEN